MTTFNTKIDKTWAQFLAEVEKRAGKGVTDNFMILSEQRDQNLHFEWIIKYLCNRIDELERQLYSHANNDSHNI